MAEFRIPELGENVASGDVTRVLVKPGDTVQKDQPVIELETDKATIEVPSSVGGVVKEVAVKTGDKVSVNQLVLVLEDAPAEAPGGAAPSPAPPAEPAAVATAPSGHRVVPGQAVPGGEVAPEGGLDQHVIGRMVQHEPDKAGVLETAADMPRPRAQVFDMASRAARAGAEPPRPATGESAAAPRRPIAPAAPSIRRLAREIGVDINEVRGTGPNGRITQDDVKEHARRILVSVGAAGGGAPEAAAPAATPALPDLGKWGEIERQPMSNVRRVTAERLSVAWQTVPHVTQYDKADITDLEELRKRYAARTEKGGGKLTVTVVALKVVAAALKLFPQFNAAVDLANRELVFRKYVHIGVAVDTERGLLVPVVRDVDRRGIIELSAELQQLSEKARARKLTLEEMEGGSFTISNLGGIGGTAFTPIVNWPEVAILGLSRASTEPVWRDGAFVPRTVLPLSLSYDHRVIDGADGIRFLRWVAEALEQPFLLALGG